MSLSAREQLEAMINGTHVDEEILDDGVNEEETESELQDNDDGDVEADEANDTETDYEDTDQDTDDEEEEETDQENDDSNEDTSDTAKEDLEEDAHNEAEESEDESENTNSENKKYLYNGVDVKEFYEKVALAKFTANGKEVEGFKDPADLIRAQQMLHGYSDKMKVFKEYKPFLKALEERKLTTDTEKFNLVMNLLDGDTEAFKKVIKEKGIDPLELDLDDIKYAPKNVLPSKAQMVIEETYEEAENLGVGDKFTRVINKDWDVKSLQELVTNSAVKNDLLQHLNDGTYDIVQNEIKRMELLDATGALDGMSSIEKYRTAVARLQQKNAQKTVAQAPVKDTVDKISQAERAKAEAEFKRKAAEKEKEVAEQRKKAASMSKKKAVKKSSTEPKLEELKGDQFREEFKKLLMS